MLTTNTVRIPEKRSDFFTVYIPIMLVTALVSGLVSSQVPEYQSFVAEVVNYALVLPWALLVSCTAYLKLTKQSPASGMPVATPVVEESATPEVA